LRASRCNRRLLTPTGLSLVMTLGLFMLAGVASVPTADAQVPPISIGVNTTVGAGIGSGIAGANVNAGVTTGSLLNGVTPLVGGLLGGVEGGVLPGSGGLLNGLLPGPGGLLDGLLPSGGISGAASLSGPLGTGASTTVMGSVP